jgi:SAM-dependent methyltransferase
MPIQTKDFDKKTATRASTEPDVEIYATNFLKSIGYDVKTRKTGIANIDKHWPSKTTNASGIGAPDLLLFTSNPHPHLFCVWENKGPKESVSGALDEAKFYIEGLHSKLPLTPGLPRLAAGFNGKQLRLAYLNHNSAWFPVGVDGKELIDAFPLSQYAINGISSNGNFLAAAGLAMAGDLRRVLPALKTIYRSIPILASGRRPIDFTVALLTVKMLVEMLPEWGTWAEQPGLVAGATNKDDAIGERLASLVGKVFKDDGLKERYGDIFKFAETSGASKEEIAFSFEACLSAIQARANHFASMFDVLDGLPPMHGADFDVFGEVYQAIGDDATKKALGEFFTGRHIISAVIPVLFERATIKSFEYGLKGKTIADIACGTGGFLTEMLRLVRRTFPLDEEGTKNFAMSAFFGYDLSQSNASRARVNMYFAGDGFSTIEGGVDTLSAKKLPGKPTDGFDFILANPPYGSSTTFGRLEEAFLARMLELLKPGAGWGLVVLPTGAIENPRSATVRLDLLQKAKITDVIALPKHAFAPYTMQRTSIVIFQRREKTLAGTNWKAVIKEVASEKISFFIVDNDGFANSDKRYPTNRTLASGKWMHNDLAGWIDAKSGAARPSKLFDAVVNGVTPLKAEQSEFGERLGKKSAMLTIKKMAGFPGQKSSTMERGLSLLPDAYLRPSSDTVSLADYKTKADVLRRYLRGEIVSLDSTLADSLKALLASPVDCSTVPFKSHKIGDVFDLKKGTQGLTEAIIYEQTDPKGMPVYGGGEFLPRFSISKASKNNKGDTVFVHHGPAIIVAMDGSSGAIRVVKLGEFCCNHHACVLKLKLGIKLNLDAVAQQIEGGLRGMASNQGSSSTLTVPAVDGFSFEMPSGKNEIIAIGARRKIISRARDRLFAAK